MKLISWIATHRLILSLVIAVFYGLIPVACEQCALFLEWPWTSIYSQVHRIISPVRHIVLVDIDQDSLKVMGRWPWDRSKMAELIDALIRAKSAVVALPILFSSEKVTKGDAALARSIAESRNLVLGYMVNPPLPPLSFCKQPECTHSSITTGHLNILTDGDELAIGVQDESQPDGGISLPFAVAVSRNFSGDVSPINQRTIVIPNFYDGSKFQRVSARGMFGNGSVGMLDGKVAVINVDIGLKSVRTRMGRMTNAEFQAHLIQNLIDGNSIKLHAGLNLGLLLVIGAGIASTPSRRLRPLFSFVLVAGALIGFFVPFCTYGLVTPTNGVILIGVINSASGENNGSKDKESGVLSEAE